MKGVVLPFSFNDSEQYWGDYVCTLPKVNCAVFDSYDPRDFSVRAAKGPGAVLQTERVNVHNGTNIYDAATWQIAVTLGAVVNKFGNLLDADAYALAANQNRVLGATGAAPGEVIGTRAVTQGDLFKYNGNSVVDPSKAYSLRMTSSAWLADDPLKGTHYESFIRVGELPGNRDNYQPGRITWSDWKPITGDNAWAYLVGPLQAAYIHYVIDKKAAFVPFDEQSVKNALEVLPTFALMQAPLGAVYYAPAGTLQNEGDRPVSPHFVSVENNLSLYAGLRILQETLRAQLVGDKALNAAAREKITRALACIQAMIAGGELPDHRSTMGLQSFFKEHAWRDGGFVQAGRANDPTSAVEWVPVLEPKAVDVTTWGISALGAAQIDAWFGFGAAHQAWVSLKSWGGCGQGRALWGVGYSDLDGNGQSADGSYRTGVLSAEWTAGAIVMVRNMIAHYTAVAANSAHYATAEKYVAELRDDERSMIAGIQKLRSDEYVSADISGKPKDYANLIIEPTKPSGVDPYLYATKRYRIPFGWYANPLPSTSSTAWIILIADNYDPFGYGGGAN